MSTFRERSEHAARRPTAMQMVANYAPPCAQVPEIEREDALFARAKQITVSQFLEHARPMDMLLVTGKSFFYRVIRRFEALVTGREGKWCHVGLVVNRRVMPSLEIHPDIQHLRNADGEIDDDRLFLWEAMVGARVNCGPFQGQGFLSPDVESNEQIIGVQIRDLAEVVQGLLEHGGELAWGRLRAEYNPYPFHFLSPVVARAREACAECVFDCSDGMCKLTRNSSGGNSCGLTPAADPTAVATSVETSEVVFRPTSPTTTGGDTHREKQAPGSLVMQMSSGEDDDNALGSEMDPPSTASSSRGTQSLLAIVKKTATKLFSKEPTPQPPRRETTRRVVSRAVSPLRVDVPDEGATTTTPSGVVIQKPADPPAGVVVQKVSALPPEDATLALEEVDLNVEQQQHKQHKKTKTYAMQVAEGVIMDAPLRQIQNTLDRVHREYYHRHYSFNVCHFMGTVSDCCSSCDTCWKSFVKRCCCGRTWCCCTCCCGKKHQRDGNRAWVFCSEFVGIVYRELGVLHRDCDVSRLTPDELVDPVETRYFYKGHIGALCHRPIKIVLDSDVQNDDI